MVLDHQMDLSLFERQSDNSAKLTNFGDHLPALQGELAQDLIKDPYIFELSGLTEKSMERDARHHMINQRTIRIRESARSDLRSLQRLQSRHR